MMVLASDIQSITASTEQTPTGWYWPTGTNDTGGWLGFMEWNEAYDGWHLAQDFPLQQGKPVYALADGRVVLSSTTVSGYGPNRTPGGALVARFQTSDGDYFAALYGHITSPHATGEVEAGEILGYTNEYNHLHFGIHPGYELAANPWMGYTHVEGETYGWVDPIQFLLNTSPVPLTPTPSPSPTPSLTPTPKPTPKPTTTPTPTNSPAPTPTADPTPTPSPSPALSPKPTGGGGSPSDLYVFIGATVAIIGMAVTTVWFIQQAEKTKEKQRHRPETRA